MPTRRLGGTMRNELGLLVPVGVGVSVPDDRIPLSKLVPAGSASLLIGRQSGSSGDWQEITLGSGLSMSGTTLSASGAASLPVVDTTSIVEDPVDPTKEMRIDVGAVSTGTIRVLTMPDQNVDLAPNTGTFPAATHASRHQAGGADAIKLDDLAAPDDNTDLDASTSAHGLLPKLGGGTTNFLRADGTWAAPPGGGGNSFETIAVSGQSDVVADSSTDTLTLVAGTNITITTNATTDTITIAASGGGTGESWHPFLLAGI